MELEHYHLQGDIFPKEALLSKVDVAIRTNHFQDKLG